MPQFKIGTGNSNKDVSNVLVGTSNGNKQVSSIWVGTKNGNKLIWEDKIVVSFTYTYDKDDDYEILQRTSNYQQNNRQMSGELRNAGTKKTYYYNLNMPLYLYRGGTKDGNERVEITPYIMLSDGNALNNEDVALTFTKTSQGNLVSGNINYNQTISSPIWIGNSPNIYICIYYYTETYSSSRLRLYKDNPITLTCYNYNPGL